MEPGRPGGRRDMDGDAGRLGSIFRILKAMNRVRSLDALLTLPTTTEVEKALIRFAETHGLA